MISSLSAAICIDVRDLVAPFINGANASDGDATANNTMAMKKRIVGCDLKGAVR